MKKLSNENAKSLPETRLIGITDVKNNPNNPRVIKDDAFKKLVKSLKDFPEMLEAREIVVNKDMVILGGNMRFRAAKDAGLKEVPVKIVDWSEDKQREFVIKDNVSGGEWDWDVLANEWETNQLSDWGLDTSKIMNDGLSDDFSLEDGDKDPFGQMSFMLATEQIEAIKEAIAIARAIDGNTFGNDNTNGNALYWIIEQWLAQRK